MLGSREFYYIQMDKFARQALAEGITSRDDIVVTMDSEIFRTLNQHYNRNNHVQVCVLRDCVAHGPLGGASTIAVPCFSRLRIW